MRDKVVSCASVFPMISFGAFSALRGNVYIYGVLISRYGG